MNITQKPLYNPLPVGQDIIFTLTNASVVSTYFNVKFIAEVFISSMPPDLTLTTDLIGTFKTTPNAAGVGIFDFSAVVETHVKADNLASSTFSQYKTVTVTNDLRPPIHLIDKFSTNNNSMKYLVIKFSVEGSTTITGIPAVITGESVNSTPYKIFNGYVKHTNKLDVFDNNFGLDIGSGSDTPIKLTGPSSSFLTNAPTTQYANIDDYGTVGVLCPPFLANFDHITFTYYNSAGGSLGTEDIDTNLSAQSWLIFHLVYVGCYPANLRNWSSTFQALVTAGTIQGGYYTVQAFNGSNNAMSQLYTINVNCPNLKNYEPIRLAWLNQWGAWDYYTFTQKSTRTISTKGSTYNQLEGTWNESAFKLNGFKGGKKSFRVNATEKIKMNTDYVNESESEWFEDLINSPEVYMLEGFQTDTAFSMLNTYVTPVRLTTSSYTRKTIANDKLMQYDFEVEKSKTFRTQSV
tara:strand:- start:959 stop:2347 length:1389 start_codon:yes stop_codon:yes gene_type:complete